MINSCSLTIWEGLETPSVFPPLHIKLITFLEVVLIDVFKRKVMLLVTFLLPLILLLAGCNTQSSKSEGVKGDLKNLNKSGFPIVKKKVKLNFLAPSQPTPDWNNVLVFNEYEKMTNMDIKWTMVSSDGIKEKTNLMLNSGDYPDAFHSAGLTSQDLIKYGGQGILIPLNDLIDKYAPNVQRLLKKYPDVKKGLTMPDGKIYSFPRIYDPEYTSVRMNWKLWLDKDDLDKLKMKEPLTLEEFYRYLKAVKTQDPNGNGKADEIPLFVTGDTNLINILKGSFGLGNRGISHPYVDADPKTGKPRFIPTDPRYKEMLEYINKLYKEDLINHDLYTVKSEQAFAKGSQGLFGSVVTTYPGTAYNQKNVVGAPAMEGPHGDRLYSNFISPLKDVGAFAITNKDPDPEATVRWIDYFYSDEGAKLFFMGVEGKTYKENPNGTYEYTDLITHNPDGLNYTEAVSKYLTWRSGGYPSIVKEKYFQGLGPSEAADKVKPYLPKEVWPPFNFTQEESDIMSSVGSDIQNYVTEMQAKFITGKASFEQWDKYVSTIKKMGLDKYMEAYTDAYTRYEKDK